MATTLKGPIWEALGHYVYALVDPRTDRIFYIGKGKGDRVYRHAVGALKDVDNKCDKYETIRDIISQGLDVKYYIIRHGMDNNKEAFMVESALIDFLTYKDFNLETILTNIVAGHHQWDRGIKSIDEIKALYDGQEIELKDNDRLMLVSLNTTYRKYKKVGKDFSLYDITRGNWCMGKNRKQSDVDYVLGVYENVVRMVIKPTHWEKVDSKSKSQRWKCEGEVVSDSPYLNKKVSDYPFGSGGAVRFIDKNTKKKTKTATKSK